MQLQKSTYTKTLFIFLCLLTLLASCGKIKKDPKYTTAIVNGRDISRSTFDKEMARIKDKFISKTSRSSSEMTGIQSEILEILIGGELLYQASVDRGISVSKKEISTDLELVTAKFKTNRATSTTFSEEDIKRKVAIEKFITKEFSDPTVIADSESKKYYNDNLDDFTKPEQIMVSHILIKVNLDSTPVEIEAANDLLSKVKEKITAGAYFDEMAKEYSQDSTAKNGGALGYIMRGQMVKPFEKVAFSLEKGSVSEIVQTKFGLHLIKILDKKPMVVISYEEIVDKLKAYLKQQQVQKKVDSFIKKQRANATIEIFLPESA